MAKHKAPTQVTIAPTEEQSAFANAVERLWKPFAAVSVVAIAAILFSQASSESDRKASHESWDGLVAAMGSADIFSGQWDGTGDAVANVRSELQGSDAEPWSMYLAAVSYGREKEFGKAADILASLKQDHPDHELNTSKFEFEGSDAALTLPEQLETVFKSLGAWTAAHPEILANPSPAADAPRVRLDTAKGPIVVALYPERAPKHCENFLKLCGEGYYDGTRFHRVLANIIIQGGDPNTRDEELQAEWGTGGPDYKIEEEDSGLYHFKGALAAAKQPGDIESSGSQFYITTGDVHGFDGRYVVYGAVVEGLEIATEISNAEIDPPDRPVAPVVVESTEVL